MNEISEYLKRRHMKQKDLAESLHCTVVTISRYASGERTPNVYTAIRIAEALKADIYDLFPIYDFNEFCHGCKEYDAERHSCPRFNQVIRRALDEAKEGKQ